MAEDGYDEEDYWDSNCDCCCCTGDCCNDWEDEEEE